MFWRAITGWLLLWCIQVGACEVLDAENHWVKLKTPAQRVISLAPDLTELLFAAGAGDKVVGVMRGSDYPPAAQKIMIVANYHEIDLERILALHPDLIVVWSVGSIPHHLQQLNIPIYFTHPRHLLDIPKTLRDLGCLMGTSRHANKVAQQFEGDYQYLKNQYTDKAKISLFYQVWPQPLMTITEASWINEVISLCGGKNIFAHLAGIAPSVSREAVLREDPAIFFASNAQDDWQRAWRAWPQLQAVKKNHLFSFSPDLIERAGPRILLGAKEMCESIAKVRNEAKYAR